MYVYVGNNPVDYVDPTGHWPEWHDVGLFLTGAVYEFSNTMSFGVGGLFTNGIVDDFADSFQHGRDLGAGIGMAVGVGEMVIGGIGALGGGALCLTGAGCVVGGPSAAISVAEAAAGAGHATAAVVYFSKRWDDWMDDDYDDTPSGKTGKGGKKSGGHANSQVRDAGKRAGLSDAEIREFGDYVEAMKHRSGRGGADNYTFKELLEMADEWKGGTR